VSLPVVTLHHYNYGHDYFHCSIESTRLSKVYSCVYHVTTYTQFSLVRLHVLIVHVVGTLCKNDYRKVRLSVFNYAMFLKGMSEYHTAFQLYVLDSHVLTLDTVTGLQNVCTI